MRLEDTVIARAVATLLQSAMVITDFNRLQCRPWTALTQCQMCLVLSASYFDNKFNILLVLICKIFADYCGYKLSCKNNPPLRVYCQKQNIHCSLFLKSVFVVCFVLGSREVTLLLSAQVVHGLYQQNESL